MAQFNTTELDFDQIKTNLKNHFTRTGSAFADFDFEGSGLSSLLDILAYNTHYNAVNAHMAMNESFLDSAQLRANVVSRAKLLGYTPSSKKAPVATINLTLTRKATSTAAEYTLVRGTKFRTVVNDVTYIFQTIEDTTVGLSLTNKFVFENLKIFQGTQRTIDYTVDNSAFQKFIINYSNVDTSTLKVEVLGTPDDLTPDTYTKFTTFTSIDSTSQIYFLNENGDGFFDVSFGDGVLGKKLSALDIVRLNFLVTDGADSNGATSFTYVSGADEIVTGAATITLVTGGKAAGGAEKESLSSVKFNAPLTFISQNRAITAEDFKTLITQNIASAGDVSVWGGEDNVPVVYGKVFLSLKAKDNFFVSDAEKERIKDKIIKPKALLGLEAELVDPNFTFVIVNSTVLYDTRKTSLTTDAFKLAIKNSIITYKSQNLDKFDSTFSLSKLSKAIDDTDQNAITGSETSVKLQKRVTPILGTAAYVIDYGEKLKRGTADDKLVTTAFNGFDSGGNARSVQFEEVPQSFSGVSRIEVNNPGFSYTVAPIVTIVGDGSGATAFATISSGSITGITLTNRGIDYTKATVEITGGNGQGGEASAVVDSRTGSIRSVFFDNDGNRQVINAAAGEVDYGNGIITINDINITSVPTSDGLIRFTIGSESGVVESVRNNIVTIDPEDPDSITVNLEVLST